MQPPEPTAPLPLSALFTLSTLVLTITFDQPLVPGLSFVGNWLMKRPPPDNDRVYPLPGATVAGVEVTGVTIGSGFPMPGGPHIDYAAAPADVVGLVGGLPAAAFAGFPVTIVP